MSKGIVIWLTGLSGAGKSTIARRLKQELAVLGRQSELLDGDEVRTHLSKGLGFSKEDRDTNIRRIGYVAGMVARSGGVVIVAAISPYRSVRDEVRAATVGFVEIYVRCPIGELIKRDVKGLYAKAITGQIQGFTGISDPYEPPTSAEVTVDTDLQTVEESVQAILRSLGRLGHVRLGVAERIARGDLLGELVQATTSMPRLEIASREFADAYLLAAGAMSPLTGFMDSAEYDSTIDYGRLPGGHPFTIPVLLRVGAQEVERLRGARQLALWHRGTPVAVLSPTSWFRTEPAREARGIYGTDDVAHPGVRLLQQSPLWAVSGEVLSLARPASDFAESDLTPLEVRSVAAKRGWRTMVGFQTRNPVHRAHEYLQKVALEIVDGLLLHPLVGETKSDDLPARLRMRCYRELLDGYFPAERVLLATNPAWMRYAGPKEAVFHAIMRRNYGCTHFIVGRDHAGVGSYYDTYAAHRIFDEYDPAELGIEVLRFEHAFFCRRCGSMASERTCPHPHTERIALSGTSVRQILADGGDLPIEFTRPEVAGLLQQSRSQTR